MWLAFATGYLKRYNLLKNAMWQLLIVSIGSILWDIFTGVAQVVGRSGIAVSLPDRGDIDGVDCKDPVTSAKKSI